MNAALSSVQLLSLLGLGLLYLLGLGWLWVGPVLHGSLTTRQRDTPLLPEIPLALVAGLLTNHGLILIVQSVKPALAFGVAVALLGLGCLAASAFLHPASRWLTGPARMRLLGASLLCLLFISPMIADVLSGWDARSIWFFHAKMIYTAGSIGLSAGWQDPTVAFSSPTYPKLVPALAAQVATVMGFWNEYFPKASLFFMLVPAVIWLFSFARRSLSFVMLLLLLPFALSSLLPIHGLFTWMWNGYMDGFLALYFAIAMLLLGRYGESDHAIDLVSAVCILLILPNIKNEGVLAALAGMCVAAWLLFRRHKPTTGKLLKNGNWKYYLASLAGLMPVVLWSVYKQQWGLKSYLQLSMAQALLRASDRLADGSLRMILEKMWYVGESAFWLLGLLCCAYIAWNRSLPRQTLPALIAGGIYCFGVVVIYLLTPFEVKWHLDTSIHRVMLSTNACMFVLSYFLLNELEGDPDLSWRRDEGTRQSA